MKRRRDALKSCARRWPFYVWLGGLLLLACVTGVTAPTAAQAQTRVAPKDTPALFAAIEANDLEQVKKLVSKGADLTDVNKDGQTPTQVALSRGHYGIAHFLLSYRLPEVDRKAPGSKEAQARPTPKTPKATRRKSSRRVVQAAPPTIVPPKDITGGLPPPPVNPNVLNPEALAAGKRAALPPAQDLSDLSGLDSLFTAPQGTRERALNRSRSARERTSRSRRERERRAEDRRRAANRLGDITRSADSGDRRSARTQDRSKPSDLDLDRKNTDLPAIGSADRAQETAEIKRRSFSLVEVRPEERLAVLDRLLSRKATRDPNAILIDSRRLVAEKQKELDDERRRDRQKRRLTAADVKDLPTEIGIVDQRPPKRRPRSDANLPPLPRPDPQGARGPNDIRKNRLTTAQGEPVSGSSPTGAPRTGSSSASSRTGPPERGVRSSRRPGSASPPPTDRIGPRPGSGDDRPGLSTAPLRNGASRAQQTATAGQKPKPRLIPRGVPGNAPQAGQQLADASTATRKPPSPPAHPVPPVSVLPNAIPNPAKRVPGTGGLTGSIPGENTGDIAGGSGPSEDLEDTLLAELNDVSLPEEPQRNASRRATAPRKTAKTDAERQFRLDADGRPVLPDPWTNPVVLPGQEPPAEEVARIVLPPAETSDTPKRVLKAETEDSLLAEALDIGEPPWSIKDVTIAEAPSTSGVQADGSQGSTPAGRGATGGAPGGTTVISGDGVRQDVALALGLKTSLINTAPPKELDEITRQPRDCVPKAAGATLFCIAELEWPGALKNQFLISTILYTGTSAIVRFDNGAPTRMQTLFQTNGFEPVADWLTRRFGPPSETLRRSIAPFAQPRRDNPVLLWRTADSVTGAITVLEMRKYDDTRDGFPDLENGTLMLYRPGAPAIFPQVSIHELLRLKRTG